LPFVYKPSPIDVPLPDASYQEGSYNAGYPTNDNGGNYNSPGSNGNQGVFPYPTLPWQESGYCPVVQTIKYVYPDGKEAGY
jgi:tyrosinase